MIFGEGFLGLVFLGLWIFCIIDVITTAESDVRNLPKVVWLLIVIFLFDVGSLAWLIAGRNWAGAGAGSRPRGAARPSEQDRPGRSVPTNPDDDEEFLRNLRQRAADQRRSYEKRQAELKADEDGLNKPPAEDA
jgi:hypothetical protein